MTVHMCDAHRHPKISGTALVNKVLDETTPYGRFATGDLASILTAGSSTGVTHRADESASLAQGSAGRSTIGHTSTAMIEVAATGDITNDMEASA